MLVGLVRVVGRLGERVGAVSGDRMVLGWGLRRTTGLVGGARLSASWLTTKKCAYVMGGQDSRRAFTTNASPSTTSSSNGRDYANLKVKILDLALSKVPLLGWSNEALSESTMELGYPPTTKGLISNGNVDLIEYFIKKCNKEMSRTLTTWKSEGKLQNLSTKEILYESIKLRLTFSAKYIDNLPQAISVMSCPANAPIALRLLSEVIDEIWYFANDKSTDFDWYTKRAVLAAVYASTEVYMLTDKSDQFNDTWSFLNRRLDDATTLAELRDKAFSLLSLGVTTATSTIPRDTSNKQ